MSLTTFIRFELICLIGLVVCALPLSRRVLVAWLTFASLYWHPAWRGSRSMLWHLTLRLCNGECLDDIVKVREKSETADEP